MSSGKYMQYYDPTTATWVRLDAGNADTVNGHTIDQDLRTTDSPTFSSVALTSKPQKINNVSTAGNFGVSTVVASASEVQLTSTNPTNVVTYTPTMNGNFKVWIYVTVVSNTNLSINVKWTDRSGSQINNVLPNSLQTTGSNSAPPVFINAKTTGAITVEVTAGTANNVYCSAIIEGV